MAQAKKCEGQGLALVGHEAMDVVGIGLIWFLFDGTVRYVNRSALTVLELDDQFAVPSEAIGKNINELVDLGHTVADMVSEVCGTGGVRNSEWTFRTHRGNEKTVDLDICLIQDGASGEQLVQVVIHRETLRQAVREALRKSEEQHKSILDSIQEGYYETDLRGTFTFANKSLCSMLGYEEGGLIGVSYRAVCGDDRTKNEGFKLFNRVYETGESLQLGDWEVVGPDGQRHVYEFSASLIQDVNGETVGFRGVVRDVTERKAAEKALEMAMSQNAALIDAIPDSILRLDARNVVLDFKLDIATPPGVWCKEEVIGADLDRLLPAPLSAEIKERISQVLDTRQTHEMEFPLVSPATGKMQHYETRLAICGQNEVMAIVRNVTKRKNYEDALHHSEERYRELFENANDIIYTIDLSGRFTSLNKTGRRISGYSLEEALDMNIMDVIPERFHEKVHEMITRRVAGLRSTHYDLTFTTKDGREVPIELSARLILNDGVPIGIQGIARDISERLSAEQDRKRLEAQVQHAQKLEGLGVLAGGIAHDFNNLLVGVMGYAGLALTKLPPENVARRYVEKIEVSAQRAAELTNQMLAYSGRGAFMVRPMNLSTLAQEMGHLLDASISKKAKLRYLCDSDLPLIQGDAAQIQQVLINLITNASDSLGDNEGTISISTKTIYAGHDYLSSTFLNDDLKEGYYVCLEVSDNGCGMDAETQSRIFDPFFSTKFAGRGLGLSATLGIVRGHRGAVKVYSEPERGTTFKVLFPVERNAVLTERVDVDIQHERDLAQWRSSGLILIADDEEVAREVARESFESHGFNVLLAENGKEAVEKFRDNVDKIRAVLLDLTMPVMSGEEAFREIQSIRNDIPVVLSSGYTEQDAVDRFQGRTPAGFVQKPYVLTELVEKLRAILANSAAL